MRAAVRYAYFWKVRERFARCKSNAHDKNTVHDILQRALAGLFAAVLVFPIFAAAAEAPDRVDEIRAHMAAVMEREARRLIQDAGGPDDQADAALAVGAIYELGMIGEADPMRAMAYFQIASELGAAEADCALGNMYASGVSGPTGQIAQDPEMAAEYYRRAAVGGSVKAMLELGKMYNEGVPGAPRDTKKALAYLMDAASRGNPEALAQLDPIVQRAKAWEEAKPGRKANFPTSREQLIKPELAKEDAARNDHLDKTASHIFVELSKRVAAQSQGDGR